jgi:hypothetical protein
MTKSVSLKSNRCVAKPHRRGIGLMEVIVCTALVAVMIVPIAGVIRASGQSIARSEGSASTEAELRRGLRWLGDTIRDSDVLVVRSNQLRLRLSSGDVATIRVRRGTLELDDGSIQTALAENVRDIRFSELNRTTPSTRIGVSMVLRARDPVTRLWVTVDSTVAIPPQA